ncbi:unnamed protein product [Caenorhabditis auriculariae]|uniref:Uncharacterized protein n=1 Tax=Caenorhabditis auriculariae TaxID=2777116 RepID=A0A8S1GME7_9PELO|nr:unnamed protein product [Caenorhabditis auriculariae]
MMPAETRGLDMATVLKESERLSELSGADREQALNVVVKYIDDWLKLKQRG